MDMLSVNTTTQTVSMPVTATVPTAQTPTPALVMRMDTPNTQATKNVEDVDMPKLAEALNTMAQKENLDISFGYNKKIDKVFINIVDKNSGEIIRKLPSEEAIKFAEGMEDLLGKLFDKKG
jgi:flagellar protein FlaG